MKDGKYGVLVHGAGWVSGQHIAAFSRNPHTEIVAISSRKLASARPLSSFCTKEQGFRVTLLEPDRAEFRMVFETLAALAYALALRGEAPHALTLAGVALLIGGVVWALRSRPQPIAAH